MAVQVLERSESPQQFLASFYSIYTHGERSTRAIFLALRIHNGYCGQDLYPESEQFLALVKSSALQFHCLLRMERQGSANVFGGVLDLSMAKI